MSTHHHLYQKLNHLKDTTVIIKKEPPSHRSSSSSPSKATQQQPPRPFQKGDDVLLENDDGCLVCGSVGVIHPHQIQILFGDGTQQLASFDRVKLLSCSVSSSSSSSEEEEEEEKTVTCCQCGVVKKLPTTTTNQSVKNLYTCRRCINKSKTKKTTPTNNATSKNVLDCFHCRKKTQTYERLYCNLCERPCHLGCLLGVSPTPLWGDRFWDVICTTCGTQQQQQQQQQNQNNNTKVFSCRRSISSWSDVAHLLLSCLAYKSCNEEKKYFSLDKDMIPFMDNNLERLHLPRMYKTSTPSQRRQNLTTALTNATLRFLCLKKKQESGELTSFWGIRGELLPHCTHKVCAVGEKRQVVVVSPPKHQQNGEVNGMKKELEKKIVTRLDACIPKLERFDDEKGGVKKESVKRKLVVSSPVQPKKAKLLHHQKSPLIKLKTPAITTPPYYYGKAVKSASVSHAGNKKKFLFRKKKKVIPLQEEEPKIIREDSLLLLPQTHHELNNSSIVIRSLPFSHFSSCKTQSCIGRDSPACRDPTTTFPLFLQAKQLYQNELLNVPEYLEKKEKKETKILAKWVDSLGYVRYLLEWFSSPPTSTQVDEEASDDFIDFNDAEDVWEWVDKKEERGDKKKIVIDLTGE